MQNKRKLAFLPLVALLGLAGCDITATPSDYEKPIVTFNNDEAKSKEVYNNIHSVVEDAYHDGSMASDVLDKVLYQYAVSIFGRYNKVSKGYKEGEVTLKEAAKDAKRTGVDYKSKTVAMNFIDAHKSYWTTDKDGKRVEGDAARESEISRLSTRWDVIEDLIAEKMYNAVSGGSYSDRSIFSEERYVESLKNSGHKVSTEGTYYTGLILPSVEPEKVFKEGLLNRSHYQSKFAVTEEETANETVRYVEDEFIPEIYNSLLVSQYLVDKKYNALGSSYARQVNIFSVTAKTDYPQLDDYLIDSLISRISTVPKSTDTSRDSVKVTLDDFKDYSNAWYGIFGKNPDGTKKTSIEILDNIYTKSGNKLFEKKGETDPNVDPYYVGTEYGEMIEKYHELDKLDDDESYKTVDTSIISDFTGSGAYVKEIGKQIKTNEIALKDNTETGWYISNGGLSTLPDSIRSRLFSFSVATAFEEDKTAQDQWDRVQQDGAVDPDTGKATWTYAKRTVEIGGTKKEESSYLARINGVYYLKNSSSSQGSDPRKDILFYDTDSSTYYVIQVLEAVRSSKIAKDSTVYSDENKEMIVNSICKCVAQTESYTTLAKKYWLEQMSIEYHDTTVYEYFLANYPELFED